MSDGVRRRVIAAGIKAGVALLAAATLCIFLTTRKRLFPAPPPLQVSAGVQDDLQRLVYAKPPGTAFLVRAGVHRMQSIIPKSGDSFEGEPGAILSGAVQLTSFDQQGGVWVARIPANLDASADQQAAAHAKCRPDHQAC